MRKKSSKINRSLGGKDMSMERTRYPTYIFDAGEVNYVTGRGLTVSIDGQQHYVYPCDVCRIMEDGKEYIECRLADK